ncbi:hypothetical protein COOONC_00639 [Cooperia oncophora]
MTTLTSSAISTAVITSEALVVVMHGGNLKKWNPCAAPTDYGSDTVSEPTSEGMIERCVVVQRQSDGYGFTVTGDHPVFVHTVKPDGAAFCAGVREGDRILKVGK